MTTKKVGKVVTTYVWVRRGGMLYNTASLDHSDPDSEYQQIIRAGEDPSEYGITDPMVELYRDKSRAEMVKEICDLKEQLEDLYKYHQI